MSARKPDRHNTVACDQKQLRYILMRDSLNLIKFLEFLIYRLQFPTHYKEEKNDCTYKLLKYPKLKHLIDVWLR